MHFQPYDLTYSALEASIIIAIRAPIPTEDLRLAAWRLLESWPMLSYRVNRAHTSVTETPALLIDDGFFAMSRVETCAGLGPAGHSVVEGVRIYDSTVLAGLFARQKKRWIDVFRPRIFTIQVVAMPNDTVLKFTMQHVAADVLGLYNASKAFFEALTGPISKRSNRLDRQYKLQFVDSKKEVSYGTGEAKTKVLSLIDRVATPAARAWLQNHTASRLFPLAVTGREWWSHWTVPLRQRMMHIPQAAIQRWKGFAGEAGAKVSKFDLVASWVHLCLADHATALNPKIKERFLIITNMKQFLLDPQQSAQPGTTQEEFWNPLSPLFIEPLDGNPSENNNNNTDYTNANNDEQRLIHAATRIRRTILQARTPAYAADLMTISDHYPGKSSQFRGQGGNNPPTIKLTSWSEAPFADLPLPLQASGRSPSLEPVLVQPGLHYTRHLPLPGSHLHQTVVCWQGTEAQGGGHWLAGNLDERLWERIMRLP